ncbi:MAG: class I SAM-dependent methyltransferase, partial [Candidatus Taylorbacteria bacterium]|nr:class I SAM-dependent methyltransferase [Candidatus Taylorbacteria bacterium]
MAMKNSTTRAEKTVREIFLKAGVEFNGSEPTDITVKDSQCFKRILADGSLGLGESYMEGWIECEDIAGMISKVILGKINEITSIKPSYILLHLQAKLSNRQSRKRSAQVANQHYNLGNDFYEAMLDKRMFYTCGYWKDAKNLDEAQEAKADLVARKLDIRPTDKLLDIGCGWGSLQNFIWEKYKTPSTGITVSSEQAKYA